MLFDDNAGQNLSRVFLCSSTPNGIIPTPQAATSVRSGGTVQNPIYLALETPS